MERFTLQPSEKYNNSLVCTDTKNSIVVVFEKHKFNDTQKFTYLGSKLNHSVTELARINSEIADWLVENHYDKLF